MNKFQEIAAVVYSLPFSPDRRLSLIEKLIAVSDNEKLLDFNIGKVIDLIDQELSLNEKNNTLQNNDKEKIELIRKKLSSFLCI